MKPAISLVVEWDNAHLASSHALAERSLARLSEELAAIEQSFEVIVVFDRADRDDVAALTARCFTAFAPILVMTEGRRYYEMKNAGFAIARGDLIVLWDSDIEPLPGALRALLDAFDDPARMVVAGAPFIDPATFLGRAWSVLSVFPPRPAEEGIERVPRFFANFVAFRAVVVERHRFAEEGRARMQCVALSARLTQEGIAIWRVRGARVKHPPPEGVSGLLQRAVWHAHDIVATHVQRGRTFILARACGSVLTMAARRVRKLVADRRALGIPIHEVPAIAAVGIAFGMIELLLVPFARRAE